MSGPAVRPEQGHAADPDRVLGERFEPASRTLRRAVIAEGYDDLRRLLSQVAVNQGFVVAEPATGREGPERVRAGDADLFTLDLHGPDLDGIEVCRQARTFSDAYIVMMRPSPSPTPQEACDAVLELAEGDLVSDDVTAVMLRRERTGPVIL